MWTPDYFVRIVKLPAAVEGVVLPNDDGTYSIYLNSMLSEEKRKDRLQHELEHIWRDHFYIETTVACVEAEADGRPVPLAPPPPPMTKKIPCFHSLESMEHWLKVHDFLAGPIPSTPIS